MPSPFPGMDPYLEHPEFFPDLHDSFITYLREFLQPRLPEPYYAETRARLGRIHGSLPHAGPEPLAHGPTLQRAGGKREPRKGVWPLASVRVPCSAKRCASLSWRSAASEESVNW